VSIGFGTEEDFQAARDVVRGAWLLVRTRQVVDLAGLFGEYEQAIMVEPLAKRFGATGIIYQSPRAEGILHRLVLFSGVELPVLYIERQEANRIARLTARQDSLQARVTIDAYTSGTFESYNVVGEIEGTDLRDEIVLIGAHLDSHALGTGAIDDGGNATVLIDIARQMKRLGIRPRRTIRFVMWNGEEQGFIGSWAYTQQHADELDRHVMAASIDVGEGPINGFFTNGRGAELAPILDRVLAPVSGLGPFVHPDLALVGTDNYDFMLNGIPNLISSQNSTELGLHYHAETDTLDKIDPLTMKRNAAILAALVHGFANEDLDLPRQSADEVRGLVEKTSLTPAMKMFGVYEDWASGKRAWR
jgi:Iap family predicted aminopeptidase